jgi:hypothetical protein
MSLVCGDDLVLDLSLISTLWNKPQKDDYSSYDLKILNFLL